MVWATALALAVAGQEPERAWADVGDWHLRQGNNLCVAVRQATRLTEGSTLFTLVKREDGGLLATLTNDGWSVKKAEEHIVFFVFPDKTVHALPALALFDHALTVKLGPKEARSIAAASRMMAFIRVSDTEERALDTVDLADSAAALKELDACIADSRRRADRKKVIPADPFKPD